MHINISDMNILSLRKSLRFYAIYKLMLCITGIQLSAHQYYLDCVFI
jgi:hypothetical protein